MNYQSCIKLLTSAGKFQIKLGLERIKSLLDLIGSPQDKLNIIHVAGTNGKGSVCAILANILKYSGYKTGLYTSPHLIEYTERIQINGVQISQNEFAQLTEEVCKISEQNNIDLTEFEILTVMAFKYFADNNVEFAVIETGLGGKFDATNVVKTPFCSIITSISLDHTDKLGDTIEKIAFEKAGIIKQGSYTVISRQNAGYGVIAKQAKKIGANIITVEKDVDILYQNGVNYVLWGKDRYEFSLLGLYQKQNLALVFAVVELICRQKNYHEQNKYKMLSAEGLKTVKWGARLEYNKDKNILIDGAHNPSGALELKKSLDYYFEGQKKLFIYGTINTKDYKTIADILFSSEDEIYYYEFKHKNAVTYDEYRKNVPFLKNIKRYKSVILKRKELKVITGSLYMIGDFMKNLND